MLRIEREEEAQHASHMAETAGRGAHTRWSGQVPHRPQAHAHGPRALEEPVPWHYTEMGRLVADAGKRDWEELTAEYGTLFMESLGVMGTRGKHVNVLQDLMGYLKKDLSSEDNAYLR
jgi:hypothetical protein